MAKLHWLGGRPFDQTRHDALEVDHARVRAWDIVIAANDELYLDFDFAVWVHWCPLRADEYPWAEQEFQDILRGNRVKWMGDYSFRIVQTETIDQAYQAAQQWAALFL